jgi:nicotinamidase-related amidase
MVPPVQTYLRFAERLTPRNAALVLVDCQERALMGADTLTNNLLGLARLARACGLPTILGARRGEVAGPILPALIDLFGPAALIRRRSGRFWADPRSRAAVEALGRRDLILAACGEDEALSATALAAVDAGYAVHAVVDASTPNERVAAARMAAVGVHLRSWVSLLAELPGSDQGEGEAAEAVRENLARYAAGSPAPAPVAAEHPY